MLNLKAFKLPSIDTYNMFTQSPYQQSYTHSDHNIKNQNPSYASNSNNTPINQIPNQLINRPIQIVNNNNMYQEVEEFNRNNQLQFSAKIGIVWSLCLLFIAIDAISISLGMSFGIFCFGVLVPSHNIIKSLLLKRWVNLITIISCLTLTDFIFMGILNQIDKNIATNLQNTQYHLIPSFITTTVLIICYNARQMMTFDCKRTLKQALYFYHQSFFNLFKSVANLNLVIIKIYSVSFLIAYIAVVWYNYYYILINATDFLNIIRPEVFFTQVINFLYIIFLYHFIIYFLDSLISWSLLQNLYKNKNRFTKIPIMIELLKVNPTQKMVQELKNKGLLINFNLFSKQESRISNNLTNQQVNNIYQRSLKWIIKSIVQNGGDIRTKIDMYYNPTSTSISEPKKQMSYWDIISEFSQIQFTNTLKLLQQLNNKIEELNIQKSNQKSVFSDLFYDIRIWYGEIIVLMIGLWCGQILEICDQIFYLITASQINLNIEGGLSVTLYDQIQQISVFAQKINRTLWINKIIRDKMQRLSKKANYIIRNSAN